MIDVAFSHSAYTALAVCVYERGSREKREEERGRERKREEERGRERKREEERERERKRQRKSAHARERDTQREERVCVVWVIDNTAMTRTPRAPCASFNVRLCVRVSRPLAHTIFLSSAHRHV